MRAVKNGSHLTVECSLDDLWDFAQHWPGSRMDTAEGPLVFTFDGHDLVDLTGDEGLDAGAVLALSHDAQAFGEHPRGAGSCDVCDAHDTVIYTVDTSAGEASACSKCAGRAD